MGWETRRYGSRGEDGGFRRVLRRIFGENENPLAWSLPLYTAWGIRVRIHLFFVVFIAGELIFAGLRQDRIGLGYAALGLATLFILVLLHEYGHCIACRRVGGTADQILLWPLGGLATCLPPYHWRAHLVTVLGGPAVNALLVPVFGGMLRLLGQPWNSIIFNPFDPGVALHNLVWTGGTLPYWLAALWWAYYTNWVLLLFNMLVPMYPMDCGRVVHSLLWAKIGDRAAMRVTTSVGLFAAVVMFFMGMMGQNGYLMGIALFGGLTCWMERRRLAMAEGEVTPGGYDFSRGFASLPREDAAPSQAEERRRERRQRKAEQDQAELDRLLAKIAREGMGSLSGSEKRWLERESERKRAQAER
jgi:stage IV sporulation protein FB